MSRESSNLRVGVYVDAANLIRNGGNGMLYGVLRDFACRGGAIPMRLNVYAALDRERVEKDRAYRQKQFDYFQMLREQGYKVVEKPVKWYTDEGKRYSKANSDLDLAVDAILQSEKLDRVLFATGDGDFVQVVRALQNKGCRVEVVAFQNVSSDLQRECDLFVSGYLIPSLLPVEGTTANSPPWGTLGSFVRGVCHHYDSGKGYGFLRYLHQVDCDLWRTDTRETDSAYKSAFIHISQMPRGIDVGQLPGRSLIFQFELAKGNQGRKDEFQAVNVKCINENQA